MKGIVYYSKSGNIMHIVWGDDVKPEPEDNIKFLEVDVPAGAVVREVDLSSGQPKLMFTEYPGSEDYNALKTSVDNISDRLTDTDKTVADHARQITKSGDIITNLELAVASLYEASIQ